MPIRNARLREQYRDKKPGCELAEWMGCCNGYGRGLQIHHITGGYARDDIWPNLILICDESHRWCHAKPIEGKIACWWAKHQMREFDIEAIRAAWGQCPIGWIESRLSDCEDPRCVAWARELLES